MFHYIIDKNELIQIKALNINRASCTIYTIIQLKWWKGDQETHKSEQVSQEKSGIKLLLTPDQIDTKNNLRELVGFF